MITLDNAEFNRALKLAAEYTSREVPKFLNGQGLALASAALRNTKKSDAIQIERQMGVLATAPTSAKRGLKQSTRKWANVYSKESLAMRIVAKRMAEAGEQPTGGQTLQQMADRLVKARKRSTGFIKSGWISAIRDLSRAVGYTVLEKGSVDPGSVQGKKKGYAKPAVQGGFLDDQPRCEIVNTSLLTKNRFGISGNPMPIAHAGLDAAASEVAREMMRHLAEKLGPEFEKLSAK